MPFDPNQPFEAVGEEQQKPAFDPSQPFEAAADETTAAPAAAQEKPAFDPAQPFEPAEPVQPASAPQFTLYEKLAAPLGAGLANSPKALMQMVHYVDYLFYKPIDAVLGTKLADEYAGKMAARSKEMQLNREVAAEAGGETIGPLAASLGEQIGQLPVQLATGGLGQLTQGLKAAINASALFGGVQSASQSFSDNVQRRVKEGQDVHEAANAEIIPSVTSGLITGAVTKGFGSTGIESVFKEAGGKAVMGKFATVLKEGGMEAVEEMVDEAGQIMNDMVNNQKVTPQDAFKRIASAAVVAGILGTGTVGLHQALATTPEIAQAQEAVSRARTVAPKTAEALQTVVTDNLANSEAQLNEVLTSPGRVTEEQLQSLQAAQGAPSTELRIAGPALTDTVGAVLAEGKIGDTHASLTSEALPKYLDANPEADPTSMVHQFRDSQGNVVPRTEAWNIAKAAGQIKPDVLAAKEASFAKDGKPPELHSQDLQGAPFDKSPQLAPAAEPAAPAREVPPVIPAKPLPEAAPPPTAREVAQAAARTPEERAAQLETGTATARADAARTGLVPTHAELRKALGDQAAATTLRAELVAEIGAKYPPEPLPPGSTESTTKNALTGDGLPSINEGGKLRPRFTNDPNLTAQQIDNGAAGTDKANRLYVPDEIMDADQLNPAIDTAYDKEAGKFYVTGVTSPFGDVVRPQPSKQEVAAAKAAGIDLPPSNPKISEPGDFEKQYRAAKALQKAHQLVLGGTPDEVQQIANRVAPEDNPVGQALIENGFKEDAVPLDLETTEAPPGSIETPKTAISKVLVSSNIQLLKASGLITGEGTVPADAAKGFLNNILKTTFPSFAPGTAPVVQPWMRVLARTLLNSKVDLSKLKVKVVNQPKAPYAGLYDNKGTIVLNTAQGHEGTIVGTAIHEILHHFTVAKTEPSYPRTPVEQKAYEDLNKLFNHAVQEIYKINFSKEGTLEELAKFRAEHAGGKGNRAYYGITNIKEFIAETLSNPRFMKVLDQLPAHPEIKTTGRYQSLLATIRYALKRLFTGMTAPNSTLDQAVEHALRLAETPLNEAPAQKYGQFTKMSRPELEAEARRQNVQPERFITGASDKELKSFLHVKSLFPEAAALSARATLEQRARELGMQSQHFIPLSTSQLQKAITLIETIGGGTTPPTPVKIDEDGWLGPDGKFHPAPMVTGGHQVTAFNLIESDPKLSAGVGLVEATQSGAEEGWPAVQRIYDFMQKNGFVRVVGGGEGGTIYINGNPTQTQLQVLKDNAIEQKATLVHDFGTRSRTLFSPEEAFTFPAADVLPPEETPSSAKTSSWLQNTVKRLFTAEGALPKEVFERWQFREGETKEAGRKATYALHDLYNAIQKEFGISTFKRMTSGLSNISTGFVQKMNSALQGTTPISAMPEGLQGPLSEMRAQVDAFSQQMIDEGLAQGELEAKFTDNMGLYLTRSYEVFDNPNWPEKVPVETRNRARAFITGELKKDNPKATEQDADRMIDSMLQDWKERGDTRFSGGRLGSMDLSVFKKRGDIDPVIRELMGEYKDPAINFLRSVSKMSNVLANARFLRDVQQKGMGTYLFTDGTQPEGFSSQIAAEGNATMAPLNGLRTTPEIAQAFQEFNKATDPGSPAFRLWMKLVSAAKGAKTVGSILTQVRNAEQFWFFAMNGHYDPSPLKDAVMATGADLGATNDPKWREFYQKMLRLNVVNQSAKANELRDALRESVLPQIEGSEFSTGARVKKAANAVLGAATRTYQISDDVGKMVGFMNERNRQETQHPDWTEAQLDQETARRIRLTYPSYSMVPEIVKTYARRQPVFGPFMTFTYESLRTTFHNLKFTSEAIVNARAATEPAIRNAYIKEAAQRMAGQMAVLGGLGLSASMLSRMLLGLSSKEEDDARKFLPPWDENAQLAFTGKEKGKLSYINLSYQNPYSVITDPVGAAVRGAQNGDSLLDIAANATGELLRPFLGEDILASAFLDVKRNKRASNGKPVYNEADTTMKKVEDIMLRFYEAFEPGTLTRFRTKMLPAARGETRKGQELSLGRELTAEFTGLKQQKLDFKDAIGYKSNNFAKQSQALTSIFRDVALREGAVTPAEIQSAYERAESQRFALWKQMHGIAMAGIRSGLTRQEILAVMTGRGGAPKDEARAIMRGVYEPESLSKDAHKRLRQMKRPAPKLVSPYKKRSLADETEPAQTAPTVP